jgi:enamine deaminase RidA (YjgF/YER057c/UK114 family)
MAKECYNVFDEMYKRKKFTWSDAVKKGKIIAISGTVATDENHRTIHIGNLNAQMRYIYESVKNLLEKMGASMDDVIKTTDYITPQAVLEYGKTGAIRKEYFKGDSYPAATGVVVHSLLRPDWLIEIEFWAVVD